MYMYMYIVYILRLNFFFFFAPRRGGCSTFTLLHVYVVHVFYFILIWEGEIIMFL